ncbi:hypothetical protein BN14_05794 [Rhizoctonia solani AG-1 IB]|nr:hypothetical protein BN14_05794 [Rhizoctonia solani AG-1 IB]
MNTATDSPPPIRSTNENVLGNFSRAGVDVIWPHNLLRLRNPDEHAYQFVDGSLCIWPSANGDTLDGRFGTPTFAARRQTAIECTTEIEVIPATDPLVITGISVYLDFESHIDLVLSRSAAGPGFEAHIRQRTPGTGSSEASVPVDSGALRVIAHEDRYEFFGWRDGTWISIGMGLAKDVSGGFTGVLIGPYAEGPSSEYDDRAKVIVKKWVYTENL